MLGFAVSTIDNTRAVRNAADEAQFRNISHAAAGIRKDAIESIKSEPGPSQPGTPPHTHTQGVTRKGKTKRGVYPRAIAFAVDKAKQEAVIGPQFSAVGDSFAAHEHGSVYFGVDYPERPTMGPALDRQAPRFGDSFAGSIGG
jgi:hypothetical protein